MKRTKKPDEFAGDSIIKWVKNGGGTFRTKDGRKIKSNQIFTARLEDIPEAFRDNIIPVEDVGLSPKQRKAKAEKPSPIQPVDMDFTIVEREDGIFDVVDGQGKAINEQPLSYDDAEELLAALKK